MATAKIDDELRDFLRADVASDFGVAVSYKKHDGTVVALTAARGVDLPTEGGVARVFSISVVDLAAAIEGETITDDGVEWKVVEATAKPVGGMLHVLARRARLFAAAV